MHKNSTHAFPISVMLKLKTKCCHLIDVSNILQESFTCSRKKKQDVFGVFMFLGMCQQNHLAYSAKFLQTISISAIIRDTRTDTKLSRFMQRTLYKNSE